LTEIRWSLPAAADLERICQRIELVGRLLDPKNDITLSRV